MATLEFGMDEFQIWLATRAITISSFALLAINFLIAVATRVTRLIYGAAMLLLTWLATICSLMILRDADGEVARIIIDLSACAVFYRLAERDKITGDRHDWAAITCFCYVFLVLFSVADLTLKFQNKNTLIASSNVLFYLKIAINAAPSLSLLLLGKRLLIESKPIIAINK